jgi:alanyl-tRNA synthetase
VGDTVECKLNAARRAAIRSNHTTTHLLNLALRKTVGGDCDQKGSLVAPDRLRFDFGHGAPLTTEEIDEIERFVNERLRESLPVYADLAPLEEAKRIHGVRALFGEAYPDPVRVVSVGASVEDLLADPAAERWRDLSIEFCGGTHLANTADCRDFVIVGEENVSKGVRRVVALTNDPASAARETGARLEARVAGAFDLSTRHLPSEVQELGAQLDAAEMPLALKHRLRAKVGELQDRVKQAQKQAAKAGREEAVDAMRELAEKAAGDVLIAEAPGVGTDRNGLMSAMDAITSKRPELAVMLFGVDREGGKLAIAAKAPQTAIDKGLKAGDWVRTAAQACGGKGGGRPDSAQGGGTEPAKLDDAIAAAERFAEDTLG